ncbi:uncharacterized protein I206_107204 [Kwoniella pini CBS 10737]|uniref:DH domain-containing protein n=1 Tax=Kwoniella pini CBS 10737 TaxID=1296096 RepID=A0AAJ8MTL9_9TREE
MPSTVISSSLKQQHVVRHRSAEPVPPPLPSKPIDLNSSTMSTDKESGQKLTRRAFICDVVLEKQGEESANLLASLGKPLKPLGFVPTPSSVTNGRPTTPARLSAPSNGDEDYSDGPSPGWSGARKNEMANRLQNLIEELVKTERSYLSRIHALKTSYADRLRLFSRDPNQQLIPPYEAKAMFANIEAIVPASAAFLADLEAMWERGQAEDHIGDVCLRHTLRTFDPYRTYLSKQEESQRLFQDSLKRFQGFAIFIESTKYQTTGIGNIGLRELLMEPVQRIPRYTLLWHKDLPAEYPSASSPPSRPLSSLGSRPLSMSSNSNPSMASFGSLASQSPPTLHAAATPLHCTLFLFNDKLMIVKRQSSSISGRRITGTDDIQKLARGSGALEKTAVKKDKLSFRGEVDILDVIASDVGNGGEFNDTFTWLISEFHIFFERPPMDQTGRWSARPFRSYTVVHPPYSVALDPVATRRDKIRFIHNLWSAQASARAKLNSTQQDATGVYGTDLSGWLTAKTGTTSCPTTPSATSHRLRPSMLNLDAISRNLFGAGSVSGKSDIFGTKGSRSTGSRSSTMDLMDDTSRKRLSHRSTSPFDGLIKSSRELIAGAPYRETIGQSEVDLNARLDLARNNSKSVASRDAIQDLRCDELEDNSDRRSLDDVEVSLRAISELLDLVITLTKIVRSETPPPTTAPLRIIRKTPSPVRILSPTIDNTPRALIPLNANQDSQSLVPVIATDDTFFNSPCQSSSPTPQIVSPRPAGPRSPIPGSTLSPSSRPTSHLPTIGSAHTRLRIVSGGGRRISVGRETVPLKGSEEGEASHGQSTTTGIVAAKRQHSADNLTPRKRSPTRSPITSRDVSNSSRVSATNASGSRRSSGKYATRRSSGPLTTPRTVSASHNSVTSLRSSVGMEDIQMKDCQDIETALDLTSKKVSGSEKFLANQQIHDAQGSNKRLKSEVAGLRKQINKEGKTKDLVQRLDRNTSLPRSPQRRNINVSCSTLSMSLQTQRIVDHENYEHVATRHAVSGRQDIDAIVMDECARGITSIVDRVDDHLRQADVANTQAIILAKQLIEEKQQVRNSSQALRSREHQDLLQRQLGDTQIELDVIYEAFNTELDGMFNDAQLPETEAFAALKSDLQTTKASRNMLELENKKLKLELEEANMKRDQWARMLRSQGYNI